MSRVTWHSGDYLFSPDLLTVAFWEPENALHINGQLVGKYDGFADGMKFSPDGKRLAYGAYRRRRWSKKLSGSIWDGGIKGKNYDGIVNDCIAYSPDSRHLAYGAQLKNQQFIVLDGTEQTPYTGLFKGAPIFAPNSIRLAYPARRGSECFVVVDGNEGKPFEGLGKGCLYFDYTSTHIAYVGYRSGLWFIVIDGEVIERADAVEPYGFRHSQEKLAYVRVRKGMCTLLVGDDTVAEHLSIGAVTFSPDGNRLAYAFSDVSSQRTDMIPIVDGTSLPKMDAVYGFSFSADGSRVCCFGERQGQIVVCLDNGTEWHHSGQLKLYGVVPNSDGSHFSYCIGSGKGVCVVVDGEGGAERDGILAAPLWKDNDQLIYAAYDALDLGEAVVIVHELIS